MSYQILARKYRPQQFDQLVGHTGIRLALENALTKNKIHHTYLITGTRGIGKTSLARLLAKCLSCEKSITAFPCEACANCLAIQKNQFIDLVEVDAASRTRIEDTQSLLENIQYKPLLGRYKIYLIDEVHMLSMHSFNALLKTLEEPPSHVIFLLATTDIQRVPETIISRCLHLPLKALSVEELATQLANILKQEKIHHYDLLALTKIAHLAKGSVRDALSLLEPVLLHGKMDQVTLDDVKAIFGYLDVAHEISLIKAIVNHQVETLLKLVEQLSKSSMDFEQIVDNLIEHFYHIALVQQTDTSSTLEEVSILPELRALAKQIQPQAVQLYYQIALVSKKDLSSAPTPELGFKMMLLRMIAFDPVTDRVEIIGEDHSIGRSNLSQSFDWLVIVSELPLTGFVKELALHSSLEQFEANVVYLLLDTSKQSLYSQEREKLLKEAISQYRQQDIELRIIIKANTAVTPAMLIAEKKESEHQISYQKIINDKGVQAIQERFKATIQTDGIKLGIEK